MVTAIAQRMQHINDLGAPNVKTVREGNIARIVSPAFLAIPEMAEHVKVTLRLETNKKLECQCNGQATLCNPMNGDCYCSTKGVIGPKCDKCEPKYIGDPKNGGTCTCMNYKFKNNSINSDELAIDFIFTFKLDSDDIRDKYVNQINFFSTPYKVKCNFFTNC